MKRTLTTSEAAHMLLQDENASWTYPGAYAMAEYLEEFEEDIGEDIEFDCVAIRCDYSEYKSLVEWASDYFGDYKAEFDITEKDDEEDIDDIIRDYICDEGQLIEFDGGIIVSSF